MVSLSIFFPCHNEQENVERVTREALATAGRMAADYEVIIVDDGSTDRTGTIADRLAEEEPCVRAVHHPTDQGYGGALQSGFRAASKEWVFYTDGDGQFDINELPPLFEGVEDWDVVTCYRLNRQDSWTRRLNAWGWNKLVNLLFGLHIRDVDCAFKLFRREIFDHIEMRSLGALIDAEILARAHRAGYRITQQGVHHYPRAAGTQSGANFRVIFRAFWELFQLRGQIAAQPRVARTDRGG